MEAIAEIVQLLLAVATAVVMLGILVENLPARRAAAARRRNPLALDGSGAPR